MSNIYLDSWSNTDKWFDGDLWGYYLDLEDQIIKIFYSENIQEYNYELFNQVNYIYDSIQSSQYNFELMDIQEYSYSLVGDDYGF